MNPSRTRSSQFAEYLAALPFSERQQLEAAERRFLAAREAPSSWRWRAERDFNAGMSGIDERIPFYLTRR